MNILDEYKNLLSGAGYLAREDRALLAVSGKDRASYLHRMISNDVNGLGTGKWCRAAMLTHKGKIQADLVVYNLDAEIWLEMDAARIDEVVKTLEMYRFMAEAKFVDKSKEFRLLWLVGSNVAEILEMSAGEDVVEISIGGRSCHVALSSEFSLPVFFLWVLIAHQAAVQSYLETKGLVPISKELEEILRIESGVPRFGVDITGENLLLEVPFFEQSLSYTKGCYMGQEPMARIHARGHHLAHKLMGVIADDPSRVLTEGQSIFLGEKEIGKTTSVCFSPKFGITLALAMLHRDGFAVNTPVLLRKEGMEVCATVVALGKEASNP